MTNYLFHTKKLITLGILFVFLFNSQIQAQNHLWANSIQCATKGENEGTDVVTDQQGNIYSIGYFDSDIDINPGMGALNFVSVGRSDIFIQKLDAQGNFIWAKQIGDIYSDAGNSIHIDDNGNLYATGSFEGIVDFDPGSGTFNLTTTGIKNTFILKLDSAGNFIWAKQIESAFENVGHSITTNSQGYVSICGTFQSNADFDPNNGTQNMNSNGGNDIFMLQLDPQGNFLWSKQIGNLSNETATHHILDANDNIFLAGAFSSTIDLDPGMNTQNFTSNGSSDIFIEKLDATGNLIWAEQIGGASLDQASAIALDNDNNIIVTGRFSNLVDFDPDTTFNNLGSSTSGLSMFVMRLDSNGTLDWAGEVKGTGGEYPLSVITDAQDNVFITGWFDQTADFDPSLNSFNLTANSNSPDMFIQKLDANGQFVWAKQIGGSPAIGNAITTDQNDNIITLGYFYGTTDFGSNAGISDLTSLNPEASHIFLTKLNNYPLEINNIDQLESFTIYPNPFNHQFTLAFEREFPNVNVSVFTISGRPIMASNYKNRQKIELELNQPPGTYFIRIESHDFTVVRKIIKK